MTIERKLLSTSPSGDAPNVAEVFSTGLHQGNGTNTAINNGIDLAGEGGMVWVKSRSATENHAILDSERTSVNHMISSNTNAAESNDTGNPFMVSFNSNGYTLGVNGLTNASLGGSGYVAWTFRKKKKFFDMVTYTGNGSARTISHGLNGPVGMMIIKRYLGSGNMNWETFHRSQGPTKSGRLNQPAAFGTDASGGYWNSTAPTDSVFSLGTDGGVNSNGQTYIAYLFADNSSEDAEEQMIKCGTVTGNGNADGPVANLGWEPQFLITKVVNSNNWQIWDSTRGVTNENDRRLYPNLANVEDSSSKVNFNSTGFKITSSSASINASGVETIYMAIRAPMMKEPEAATEVFKTLLRTGTNGTASVTGVGFPFDVLISRSRNNGGNTAVFNRLFLPSKVLHTNETAALIDRTGKLTSFDQDGFSVGADNENIVNASNNNYVYHAFKRAKGFFDVVAYSGTGSARTQAHSLGVVPEMMWVKCTNSNGTEWGVYHTAMGNTKFMFLQSTQAASTHPLWNDTNPTDSVFSLGSVAETNGNNKNYIAYLFATLDGISKVGTFVSGGSGVTVNVDCGFSNGARFVLIKALTTDSWYFWDTARGIVSGNDSRLSLDSTNAAVTNQDNIDPYSAGFSLNGTLIGNSGNTFIFYAVA